MNWLPSLPLLSKELTESAARKRTYKLRVAFALLLFIAFALGTGSMGVWNTRMSIFASLGRGRQMFEMLVVFLLFSVALFTPAMCAGLITSEKERDSLTLLLLTKLSPWQILLQKYLGGLVPIFSLLLLGLPLVAIAYSYGGIPLSLLWSGTACLFLMAAQVAAIALLCSAYFRTSVSVFLATYLFAAFVYATPILICEMLDISPSNRDHPLVWLASVFTPVTLFVHSKAFSDIVTEKLPAFLSIFVFLALARRCLVRRAFVTGSNSLGRIFGRFDALMKWVNGFAGNITFKTTDHGLPSSDPIAWREIEQKALAQPRYLLRLLVAVEFPVIAGCIAIVSTAAHHNVDDYLIVLNIIIGIFATLLVSANAANSFVSERIQQTLDVILTTPISAREIVRQKAQVIRRLLYVVAAPIATVELIRVACGDTSNRLHSRIETFEGLCLLNVALALVIYLPLVSWLSIWIGLRVRTRFVAITTAIGVIFIWCIAPVFLAELLSSWRWYRAIDLPRYWLYYLSPLSVPLAFQNHHFAPRLLDQPEFALIFNYALYGVALRLISQNCLDRANFYLRR